MLAKATQAGTVVVPPEVKASALVREVVSSAIGRIEADRILEERVIVDAVDLFYRPVYAFPLPPRGQGGGDRVRRAHRRCSSGRCTLEQYLGKAWEPKFLPDAGVEAVNLFVPGTQLARIVVQHGVKQLTEHRNREA